MQICWKTTTIFWLNLSSAESRATLQNDVHLDFLPPGKLGGA